MISTAAVASRSGHRSLRTAVAWGVVFGVLQAAAPLALFWLDSATVYALSLPLIAAVYIGFAVADGRPHVLAVETSVVTVFVLVAAATVTGSPCLIVAGLAAPHRLRRRHPLVAAVLCHRRLRCRRTRRRRDRGRPPPPVLTSRRDHRVERCHRHHLGDDHGRVRSERSDGPFLRLLSRLTVQLCNHHGTAGGRHARTAIRRHAVRPGLGWAGLRPRTWARPGSRRPAGRAR